MEFRRVLVRSWVAQQVTRGSCRSVQNAMRLDITGGNADGDQDEQGNRYRDAPGQRFHRAAALTLVDHHVVQAGTEVEHNHQQEGNDEQFPIGRASGRERVCQSVYISLLSGALKKKKLKDKQR